MAARKKSRKNTKTKSKAKNRSKKAAKKKNKLLPQKVILERYNKLDKLIRRNDWDKRPKGGW